MADTPRQTPRPVVAEEPHETAAAFLRAVEIDPRGFDFFHVLRCIDAMHPQQPRLGQSKRATDDSIRIGQNPQLGFAPSALEKFEGSTETRPARLWVHFLGLWGANGPLPYAMTEYARDRLMNEGDATLARFVDLFHHRLLCLFYRTWATAQPAVQLDRPQEDQFGEVLGAIAGDPFGEPQGAGVPHPRRFFTGHFANHSRPAGSLRQILEATFGVRVEIAEFKGQWLEIPERQRFSLGSAENSSLGYGGILGESVWETQTRFQILLGPLSPEDYQRFLPRSDAHRESALKRLHQLVRDYVGSGLQWEVELRMSPEHAPRCSLGTPDEHEVGEGSSAQLGWTSWLSSTHAPALGSGVLCDCE